MSGSSFFTPIFRKEVAELPKKTHNTFTPTRFMLPTSHYDSALADHAVAFIQSLKHTKGVWAGKPFELLPWQEEIVRNIFGVIKESGY